MYYNFWEKNKLFFAIIIGAVIIGGFVYLGLKNINENNEKNVVVANLSNDKNATTINFLVPKPKLSTDNGLMTAITGFYHKKETKDWHKIEADGNLRIE